MIDGELGGAIASRGNSRSGHVPESWKVYIARRANSMVCSARFEGGNRRFPCVRWG